MVFVAYGQGQIQGGRMRGMHPQPAIFKYVFDKYNFSIISNLCDNNTPSIIENVRIKCIISSVKALRITVKTFKQNLPESYSKSTKIAIMA